MKKNDEPSKASLRQTPEVDFTKMKRLARGKYAERARRSFAIAVLDPELFAHFGSSEAINAALRALVEAASTVKRPRTSKASKGHRRSAA